MSISRAKGLMASNLLGNILLQCVTVSSELSTQDMKCVVVFVPGFDYWRLLCALAEDLYPSCQLVSSP